MVTFRRSFLTERGKQITEEIASRRDVLDARCRSSNERCEVRVTELEDGRLQVAVTRPRALVSSEDWFRPGPSAHTYRRTFHDPRADEVTRSITQFLERPLVEFGVVGTTEEFLRELGTVRDQFQWSLVPDDSQTADRRAWLRFRLRGAPQTGPAVGRLLDPIGAVCYAGMHKVYEHEDWQEAARTIGLPIGVASDLISASNHRTWNSEGRTRRPDPHLEWLRSRLIAVLGPIFPSTSG